MYYQIVVIHFCILGSVYLAFILFLLSRIAYFFIRDEEGPSFTDNSSKDAIPECICLSIFGIFTCVLAPLVWPAIYIVGLPLGGVFLARHCVRKSKAIRKELEQKIRNEVLTHETKYHKE